jgi:hypothetical protein
MTDTDTFGTRLQTKFTNPIWNRENNFVFGTSFDYGGTDYSDYGELGTLLPNPMGSNVIGSGVIIDQGLSQGGPKACPKAATRREGA